MSVICPYCRKPAKFMESSALIYHGRNYGPVYACMPCGAWVGCHPNTTRPLGRLANAELREMKMKTHAAFDPIWTARFERKHAIDPRYKKAMARGGPTRSWPSCSRSRASNVISECLMSISVGGRSRYAPPARWRTREHRALQEARPTLRH